MRTTRMQAIVIFGVFAHVAGHAPEFPGRSDGHHHISAEPSQAWYFKQGSEPTLNIEYGENDPMYLVLYTPKGTQLPTALNGSGNCTVGTDFINDNDHIKNHTIGELFYEPFSETELRVAMVVYPGVRSPIAQTCAVRISGGNNTPFVAVVGTTEEPLMSMIIGLPIIIMHVAAWMDRYLYGMFLVVTMVLVGLVVRKNKRWYMYLISVIFVASAVNRYSVATTWGWGLCFSIIPLLLAVAVHTTRWWLKAIVWTVALVTPTRSWLDVACLTVAYAYEYFRPTESTNGNVWNYAFINNVI